MDTNYYNLLVTSTMINGKKYISLDDLMLSLYKLNEPGYYITVRDLINALKSLAPRDTNE